MKKLISLLLTALLLFSMIPVSMAEQAEPADPDEIWEQIEALESETIEKRGLRNSVTAADFAAMADDVAELVTASSSYVEGTLERHGDFFFWETKDGTANGYSPRLRAKLREGATGADPEVCTETVTDSYAVRTAGNNSVKVAVFQPYYGLQESFQATYAEEGKRIASSIGGSSTTYRVNDASITNVALAMENCGVIIFDSHGDTDYWNENDDTDFTSRANTSYFCLQTGSGITGKDMEAVSGKYGTYYHAYYAGKNGALRFYCVDGTAIANHMTKQAQRPLVWMALCLSMATDGLEKPLRNKGVGVVYGYSQSVSFTGDYIYEEYFFDHLLKGYNVAKSISYMKSKAGCNWDPAYGVSSITLAKRYRLAFPIVVSDEDKYPGKGKVDAVQTPKSTWKLKNQNQICVDCPSISAFTDAPEKDNWAHDPIDWALTNGITNGISNTKFGPNAGCTRAQVVTFLWRAAGEPEPAAPTEPIEGNEADGDELPVIPLDIENPFEDVKSDAYYYTAVLWAVSKGITTGTSAAKFSPDKTCTRAQIVTFIWRYEGEPEPESSSNPFKDVAAEDYYLKAVLWAAETGVTSGTSPTTFSPKSTCTRAQVVTFLYRDITKQ